MSARAHADPAFLCWPAFDVRRRYVRYVELLPRMPTPSSTSFTAILAGGLATLQAVLGLIAGLNGGLTGVVINERLWVLLAIAAVAAAVLCGTYVAVSEAAPRRKRRVTGLAIVLLLYATAVALYAAVVAPNRQGRPQVSASLEPGSPLLIKASVKASGIARSATVNVAVLGLDEAPSGYTEQPPYLYRARIGPDASGNVDDSFSTPVPVGKYQDVAVAAWAGKEDPCVPPDEGTKGTPPIDKGCVIIRLVSVGRKKT